jgi:hypothetical protein
MDPTPGRLAPKRTSQHAFYILEALRIKQGHHHLPLSHGFRATACRPHKRAVHTTRFTKNCCDLAAKHPVVARESAAKAGQCSRAPPIVNPRELADSWCSRNKCCHKHLRVLACNLRTRSTRHLRGVVATRSTRQA